LAWRAGGKFGIWNMLLQSSVAGDFTGRFYVPILRSSSGGLFGMPNKRAFRDGA